jgi:hypothetical protein
LSYLPGPLLAWQVYVAVDGLILLLAVWAAWQTPQPVAPQPDGGAVTGAPAVTLATDRRWLLAGLLLLLGTGGLLRLLHLGYAEFHGDEARAVLRAAAVIQGYEDVLFLHKKGPTEILLPSATFALTGRLSEASARLPFALANLAALLAVWLLGARLAGPLAGWAAAMLLAVDGYFIGFARIVQYQSVVILTSALVVLVLARLAAGAAWGHPRAETRYLTLAALFFATGLWSHYEGALVAAPALYLLAVMLRRQQPAASSQQPTASSQQSRRLWRALAIGVAVGTALLALFYLPFMLHPQFGATYTYLVERRLGGEGFPFNNVADFFIRTTIYSSTYYVLFLIGLTVVMLIALYRRSLGPRLGALLGLLLIGGLVVTAWQPAWLAAGQGDWLALFFLLALLPAWLLPGTRPEERVLWIWFGLGLVGMLFFTGKPRTHVYVFFTPWALLAGLALDRGWRWLVQRIGLGARPAGLAAWAGGAAALLLTGLFGFYAYQLFAYTEVEVLHGWPATRPAGYWTAYDVLDNRALFGFPLANGWKAAGMLYQEGEIEGDYATNEVEFWTPLWYTRGRMRCEAAADWFFQISNPQPDPAGYRRALEEQLAKEYRPWGVVEIDDTPRMVIRRRSQQDFALRTFPLEEYAAAFDAQATPDLPLGYPVVEPPIAHPLHANFGDLIWLEGYALDHAAPLQPGDAITLTLYWRAQQPIADSYKVFNQSYYGDGVMVAQQDGYPVCGSRGTWLWDPGELVADVHTLTIRPDAPPGRYPLYTGLYIEETFERLSVLDERGAPVADQVHLTDIQVGATE